MSDSVLEPLPVSTWADSVSTNNFPSSVKEGLDLTECVSPQLVLSLRILFQFRLCIHIPEYKINQPLELPTASAFRTSVGTGDSFSGS
jgi:hypothetical protein